MTLQFTYVHHTDVIIFHACPDMKKVWKIGSSTVWKLASEGQRQCPLKKTRSSYLSWIKKNWIIWSRSLNLLSVKISWSPYLFKNIYLYSFIWLYLVLVVVHGVFSRCLHTLSFGMWDLVPWPGIEPGPPTLGAQSLRHCTPKEVP